MIKVIKLGGSLLADKDALIQCLQAIHKYHSKHDKIVIVPGGGVFADQVRQTQLQWAFDEQTAHHMAVLAMQQMALLFNSIISSFIIVDDIFSIEKIWLQHQIVIWSPDIKQLNGFSIKASWDISSDSLAAWLAGQLAVEELILVKSAEIPFNSNLQDMAKNNLVDKAFLGFVQQINYQLTVINKHQLEQHLLASA